MGYFCTLHAYGLRLEHVNFSSVKLGSIKYSFYLISRVRNDQKACAQVCKAAHRYYKLRRNPTNHWADGSSEELMEEEQQC